MPGGTHGLGYETTLTWRHKSGLIIIRASTGEVTMTTSVCVKCVTSVSVRKDQIAPDNVEYEVSKKPAL